MSHEIILKKLRHVMYKNANGFKRVKKRSFLRAIFNDEAGISLNDREFRALVADEPRIITHTKGYYIIKKNCNKSELMYANIAIRENMAKASALIKRHKRQMEMLVSLQHKRNLL